MKKRNEPPQIPATRSGTVPIRKVEDPARHRKPWQLTHYAADGKRIRTFFATEKEALQEWKRLAKIKAAHGVKALEFDADAYAEWREAKRLAGPNAWLPDIVQDWKRLGGGQDSINIGEAAQMFLERKRSLGLSEVHIRGLETHMDRFVQRFGGESMHGVSRDSILDYLKEQGSPRTQWNHRITLHTFWHEMLKSGKVKENPVSLIGKQDLPKDIPKPKGILSVEEVRTLLDAVKQVNPKLLPYFALRLFAGIRRAEAHRFEFEFIDHARKRIVIPARICKTADDWVLQELPDNIWKWLPSKASGPIPAPSDFIWKKILAKANLADWPDNAMRRSFCSHHIALHSDAAKTAALMRHRSPSTLYRSYLASLPDKTQASLYFKV